MFISNSRDLQVFTKSLIETDGKFVALARPTWQYHQNEDGGKSLKELLYPSISNVVSLSQCFRVEINQTGPTCFADLRGKLPEFRGELGLNVNMKEWLLVF